MCSVRINKETFGIKTTLRVAKDNGGDSVVIEHHHHNSNNNNDNNKKISETYMGIRRCEREGRGKVEETMGRGGEDADLGMRNEYISLPPFLTSYTHTYHHHQQQQHINNNII